FLEFAVWPELCALAEKVTNDVLPDYGANLRGAFEDVRLKDKQFELQEQQEYAKTHTIDEIRKKYYSDDPIGDERGDLLPAQVAATVSIPQPTEPDMVKPAETQTEDQEVEQDPEQESEQEMDQDPDEENAEKGENELKAWERKALSRIKAGKIAAFESQFLPERIVRNVKAALRDCKTADDVRDVFACKAVTRGRDPDEPRREQKESLEDKIVKVLNSRWKRQAVIVQQRLEQRYPMRQKSEVVIDLDFLDHDEEIEGLEMALMRLIIFAATDGVEMFAGFLPFDIDYSLTNAEAASWATQYTGDLIKDIDTTTLKVLRESVTSFVDTPGMTIGDVMSRLPYSERRARLIAVTEITNAYAAGEQMAGDALAEQFPGVPVVKTWWTNQDDRVCPVCGPVHGQTVDINDAFSNGRQKPSAHPGCRCWVTYTTRLAQ
ncbi:MAG: phage minor head protein, partial [Anaerolineaceae bacterium]